MRVSVIVPVIDEEQSIGRVLADLPRDHISEVIVVDGGSRDRTREVARAGGARVIEEPRRGYGRACLTGVQAADRPDVLVFLDGDYSDFPEDLPALLEPIAQERAELVLGSRLLGGLEPGALPGHQIFGNRLAAFLIHRLYGVTITDLGPFRAIRQETFAALEMRQLTYGWPTEMIAKTARLRRPIAEVPVRYRRRIGVSKVSGTVKGSALAAYYILSTIFRTRVDPCRPSDLGSRQSGREP